MSKVWKVVSTVAIVALILGALCILAGFVTGGDVQRVKDVFFASYDIENKINALRSAMGTHKCGQYGYKILCSALFSNYHVFGIIQEIKIMG